VTNQRELSLVIELLVGRARKSVRPVSKLARPFYSLLEPMLVLANIVATTSFCGGLFIPPPMAFGWLLKLSHIHIHQQSLVRAPNSIHPLWDLSAFSQIHIYQQSLVSLSMSNCEQ